MKKLLMLLLICLCAAHAHAALLFYDGFDYTDGQPLAANPDPNAGNPNGQLNTAYNQYWRYAGAGTANTAAPSISTGSLSTPGLKPSTGNKVSFNTTQLGSARIQTSGAINSGTVYWSGLLRVNDVSNLNAVNGMLLGGFNNTPGPGTLPTSVGAVLRIRKDTSDVMVNNRYFVGTAMNSGTGAGNIQYATGSPLLAGDTVFVVASYEFVAGATNDIARMWVNPNPADFGGALPPLPTITSAPGLADSFASLSTFNLRNVNTVGAPSVDFDELRVGTDWASVTVPEPTSLGLFLLGCCLITLRRNIFER